MNEILIITICVLLILVGLVGLVIPLLPSSPLVFLGVLIYAIFTKFTEISPLAITILGILTLVVFVSNYFMGIYTAKKFGATKFGIYGGIIGILVGLLFSPFGLVSIIICPVLGTIVGEVIAGKKIIQSGKVGLGNLIGFLAGIFIEVVLISYMIFIFIKAVF